MRTLTDALLLAQESLNRAPTDQIITRDVMLRWNGVTALAYIGDDWPDTYDEVSNLPQCPIDQCVAADDYVWRLWIPEDGVDDKHYVCHVVADPSNPNDWKAVPGYTDLGAGDAYNRPSVTAYKLMYSKAGHVYYRTIADGANIGAETQWLIAVYSGPVAVAGYSGSANTDVAYTAELVLTPHSNLKYLLFKRSTRSGASTITTENPRNHIVDSDYCSASLTFFDAVHMATYDVIIFNDRAWGRAMVMRWEDDVWSEPYPLVPLDVLTEYSNIQVTHATVIADSDGDDVIWASARITRGTENGLHPQAADIVMRSKDGIHWTLDRYRYIGSAALRSKLLPVGDNIYMTGGQTVNFALSTWLTGDDPATLKETLTDDIKQWSYAMPGAGRACAGNVDVPDSEGEYSNDGTKLLPGRWLWRYAGYNSLTELLSTEIIDVTTPTLGPGGRALRLRTRDSVMRQLYDWSSDQVWQWMSMDRHYDDCDVVDQMAPLGSGKIAVMPDYDAEPYQGGTRSEELRIWAPHEALVTDSESERLVPFVGLKFQDYNRPSLWTLTSPYEAEDFQVNIRFTYNSDDATTQARPSKNDADGALADPGTGIGAAGCIYDQYNYVMGFAELTADDGGTLKPQIVLYAARGNKDDGITYTQLDVDQSSRELVQGDVYEVQLIRWGRKLRAKLFHFAQTDSGRYYDGAVEYDWGDSDTLGQMIPNVDDNLGQLGMFANIHIARSHVKEIIDPDTNIARRQDTDDTDHFSAYNGDDEERNNYVDDYRSWATGLKLLMEYDDEEYDLGTISSYTHSNVHSMQRMVWDHDDDPARTLTLCPAPEDNGATGITPEDFEPADYGNDGDGGVWYAIVISGAPGREEGIIISRVTNWAWGGGGARDSLEMLDVPDADWANFRGYNEGGGAIPYSQIMMVPGFTTDGVVAWDDAWTGRTPNTIGPGPASAVNDDHILIKDIYANDWVQDKSVEFVLRDIVTKAGPMDFDVDKSINQEVNLGKMGAMMWLTDVMRNCDIQISTPAPPGINDMFIMGLRMTTNTADNLSSNVSELDGLQLTYQRTDTSEYEVKLYQTTSDSDSEEHGNWLLLDGITWSDNGCGGQQFRVVLRDQFLSFYARDRLLKTFWFGRIIGSSVHDNIPDKVTGAGYIGIYADRGTAAWDGNTVIWQPELWSTADAVVLSTKMNAMAGIRRAIRDRHIKVLSKADGTVRMSLFDTRDDLGNVTDHVSTDAEWAGIGSPKRHASLFRDTGAKTDRIPTHVRVVGAEETDYIDHDNAAEYGWVFMSIQAPYLDDEEAYDEALRIVNNSLSKASTRRPTLSAQLHWEPEDEITLIYTPIDGSDEVNDTYIVDTVTFTRSRNELHVLAMLRKKYG